MSIKSQDFPTHTSAVGGKYGNAGIYVWGGGTIANFTMPVIDPPRKVDWQMFFTKNIGTGLFTQNISDGANFNYTGATVSTWVLTPGDFACNFPLGNSWLGFTVKNPARESSGVRSVSASATVANTDATIRGDATAGAVVLTLPSAASSFANGIGNKHTLVKTDASANNVSFARAGSDTINGASTNQSAGTQWGAITVQAISTTEWAVIARI